MARPIAQYTLDGYAGRMNHRTGMVEFGPPVRRQFSAADALRAQIVKLRAQVAATLARAEVAEAALARIQLSAPAVSPATTPADAFAVMAGRIYSERRQMQMSAPVAAPEPPQASLGMAAEAIYAARRKAAQRLL